MVKSGLSKEQMEHIIKLQKSNFYYSFAEEVMEDIEKNFKVSLVEAMRNNKISHDRINKILGEAMSINASKIRFTE